MSACTASTQAPRVDDDDDAAENSASGQAGCAPAISVGNVTFICTSLLGPGSLPASTAAIKSVNGNDAAVPVYASRNKSAPMSIGGVANGSHAMLREVALHLLATITFAVTAEGRTLSLARNVTSAG